MKRPYLLILIALLIGGIGAFAAQSQRSETDLKIGSLQGQAEKWHGAFVECQNEAAMQIQKANAAAALAEAKVIALQKELETK